MSKKLIEQFMDRLWNQKDLTIIEAVFAADAVVDTTMGKREGSLWFREVAEQYLSAFPDMQVHIKQIFEEGQHTATYWLAEATHKGEIWGYEPSGNRIRYSGVTLYQVHGEKITWYKAFSDQSSLLTECRLSSRHPAEPSKWTHDDSSLQVR